jgi:hypothetical protein
MAGKTNKKKSLLCVLEVLREYSDKNHVLKQSELLDLIDMNYDLKIDRRTLYANVALLKEFGYEISDFSDNGYGYYLGERHFSERDIKTLVVTLQKDEEISDFTKERIIEKLVSSQSKYRIQTLKKKLGLYK